MLDEIPYLINAGKFQKAQRWLGFIQGLLWRQGVFSIKQMCNHNREEDGGEEIATGFDEWAENMAIPEEAIPWAREAWNAAATTTREACAQTADDMACYYRAAEFMNLPVEPSPIISRDRAEICERIAERIRAGT